MRNSERIPEILDMIKGIWEKSPDLRFFQIIALIKCKIGSDDPFFYEDDKLLEELKKM
jgi:uncharacterized protein YihD (DUF1040 family)